MPSACQKRISFRRQRSRTNRRLGRTSPQSHSTFRSREKTLLDSQTTDERIYPIVLDTGASVSITPLASDFVTPIQPMPGSSVRGLSSSISIAGIGFVEWTLRDVNGNVATVRTKAYHIPEAEVRLFSPQVYFQENNAGSYLITKDSTVLTLADGLEMTFPYFLGNNLPMAFETTSDGRISFDDLQEIASKT